MNDLVKQPRKRPTRKVSFAGLGALVATVAMGLLAIVFPDAYRAVSAHPGFETAVGGLLAVLFGYFAKERA